MTVNKLSYLVNSLLPEYIKEEYPNYVSFIEHYLRACEEESGPINVLYNLTQFIDVDIVPEEYLNQYISQYLNSFPTEWISEINIREFITNAKDFYSQKGTESAIRFIFNLMNGKISFYYPGDDIFTVSSSLLSGNHKIHDNKYYAYYVYEIETDLDYNIYSDILFKMAHPAGMKLYANRIVEPVDGIVDASIKELYEDCDIEYESTITVIPIETYSDLLRYIEQSSIPTYLRNLEYYTDPISSLFSYTLGDFYSYILGEITGGIIPSDSLVPGDTLFPSVVEEHFFNIQRSAEVSLIDNTYPNEGNYPADNSYPSE